jgi:hypothetical protein
MRFISHRGNLSSKLWDSNPYQIQDVLSKGYDCEIDIWKINDDYYLGHSQPSFDVSSVWLEKRFDNLLLHCKNPAALADPFLNKGHLFWHEEDRYTITNRGIPVCYPGVAMIDGAIQMKVEEWGEVYPNGWGACSDYIERFK